MKWLVNQNGQFNPSVTTIPTYKYSVAVIGNQSTGKSTMLNCAFGTNFECLDTQKGRQQCTKGIWFDVVNVESSEERLTGGNRDAESIIVFDTEGFDSEDRKEDQSFERKVALFSLAAADLLIVNIWHSKISGNSGSQADTLSCIIKAYKKIESKDKKQILFAIRDCVGNFSEQLVSRHLEGRVKDILRENGISENRFSCRFLFFKKIFLDRVSFLQQAKKIKQFATWKTDKMADNTGISFLPQVILPHVGKEKLFFLKTLWENIQAGKHNLTDIRQAVRQYIFDKRKQETFEEWRTQAEEEANNPRTDIHTFSRYIERQNQEIKSLYCRKKPAYMTQQILNRYLAEMQALATQKTIELFESALLPRKEAQLLNKLGRRAEELTKSPQRSLENDIRNEKNSIQAEFKEYVFKHRESERLVRNFNERVECSLEIYKSQCSSMKTQFQVELLEQIVEYIDMAIAKETSFDPSKIESIKKKVCQKYKYNVWELVLQSCDRKALEDTCNKLLNYISRAVAQQQVGWYVIDARRKILLLHKKLKSYTQKFISEMAEYLRQPHGPYFERIEAAILESQSSQLSAQVDLDISKTMVEFQLNLEFIVIFLVLFSGQWAYLLRKFVKKSNRWVWRWLFKILLVGSLLLLARKHFAKRILNNSS